jgi:hypothetical protein
MVVLQIVEGLERLLQEPVNMQTLGLEAPVERLDERVVGGFAWSGEVERDAALISPQIQIE